MTFKIDREILKIADYIEKLAFEMKAPNIYTPRFVSLANEIRTAIHTRLAQPEQKPVAQMREMLEVQGRDGTWDCDTYSLGMYNGMEFMVALAEGREPVFRGPPERWLHTPQQRQPLTYAEMKKIADEHLKSEYQPASYEMSGVFDLIRAVEYTKLKEMK